MNTYQHFMALIGSVIIVASCKDTAGERKDVNAVADQQSVVDTIPTRSNTSPTGMGDTIVHRYINLNTGEPVDLYYDPKARKTYSVNTNEPIEFYIDMNTGDTVYGQGRFIVNNFISKSDAGTFKLNADKIKMDKDEIKIKEGNKKLKIDNSTMKLKDGDLKMKTDTVSGKIKTGDLKKKMEGDRSKTKG
ncbi:hypothetical protein A4D02_02465 [Niastella koreensis]|uniref:Uncharacterized protein n=2 Tax=Niastella koreensis TaxID=354356 RepID=G8TIL6_NIAKG|nr:hypothetical protein [Niastella koreensis]AEW02869.1 hypothetical protein Niako_6645 [Niastella koreensis GR20-10]OQP55196.1 hypothetical protein A4D02_02465 [Niastella koreensis]